MMALEELLRERLATAFESVAGERVDPAVRRSQQADFQSDGALALARKLTSNPRAIAERVVEAARLDDVCSSVEVSGPGFINLMVANSLLGQLLLEASADDRLGVAPDDRPETIIVDYSAPNAAKEMHVGHLRSTIIGDALSRVLSAAGHRVIPQNHLGDWGTPFGMLIEHLVDVGQGAEQSSIGDLNDFYKAA